MKKFVKKTISAMLVMSFALPTAIPTFASSGSNSDLQENEIIEAFEMYAPSATNHILNNADDYEIPADAENMYYGSPFYMFNYNTDTNDVNINKEIIYYPLVADEEIVSVLALGKDEDGSLFSNIGKSFSDTLNSHANETFALFGDGKEVIAMSSTEINRAQLQKNNDELKTNLIACYNDSNANNEGVINGEDLIKETEPSQEVFNAIQKLQSARISSSGGRLTSFPKVRQTETYTCASACVFATARYLDNSTFKGWKDMDIHNLVAEGREDGVSPAETVEALETVLNTRGNEDLNFDYIERKLTAKEITTTLYNNELPAMSGYARSSGSSNRGHFVALCGFSKTSTVFSAEFMDPDTYAFIYSTAADNKYTLIIKGITYKWASTITME